MSPVECARREFKGFRSVLLHRFDTLRTTKSVAKRTPPPPPCCLANENCRGSNERFIRCNLKENWCSLVTLEEAVCVCVCVCVCDGAEAKGRAVDRRFMTFVYRRLHSSTERIIKRKRRKRRGKIRKSKSCNGEQEDADCLDLMPFTKLSSGCKFMGIFCLLLRGFYTLEYRRLVGELAFFYVFFKCSQMSRNIRMTTSPVRFQSFS